MKSSVQKLVNGKKAELSVKRGATNLQQICNLCQVLVLIFSFVNGIHLVELVMILKKKQVILLFLRIGTSTNLQINLQHPINDFKVICSSLPHPHLGT